MIIFLKFKINEQESNKLKEDINLLFLISRGIDPI